jgi:peptide/nickel transport system substrate-binding protein
MTNGNGSTPEGARFSLSRRQVFQYSGVAAAAVGGASLLEACGSDSSGGGGGGTGGILVHGATGGSAKDTLDAHRPVQNADIARCFQLYEPLLYWDQDYKVQSAVAESVTPSADAKTWTI